MPLLVALGILSSVYMATNKKIGEMSKIGFFGILGGGILLYFLLGAL